MGPHRPAQQVEKTNISTINRDSMSSASLQPTQDQLNRALDSIHSSASQRTGLTSFDDFEVRPSSSPNQTDSSEKTQYALSNLYGKLKSAVGTNTARPESQQYRSTASTEASIFTSPSSTLVQARPIKSRQPPPPEKAVPNPLDSAPSISMQSAKIQSSRNEHTPASPNRSSPRQSFSSSKPSRSAITTLEARLAQPTVEVNPITSDPQDAVETAATRELRSSNSGRSISHETNAAESSIDVAAREHFPTASSHQPPLERSASEMLIRPKATKAVPTLMADARTYNARLAHAASSDGTASPSERSLSAVNTVKQTPAGRLDPRKASFGNSSPLPNDLIYQMQHKVLSKDFWMKDENAKVCFNCGDSFTTFRRKHHCRKPNFIKFDADMCNLLTGNRAMWTNILP